MSFEEIVEERDGYRVILVTDDYPEEPYNEGQSPILRTDTRYLSYASSVAHLDAGWRGGEYEYKIEEAACKWGPPSSSDWYMFERYMRAFHGVTKVETYYSGSYWYVTYDSSEWRAYTGAPAGSIGLEEYKAWIEGEVYGYQIQRLVSYRHMDNETSVPDYETWEEEDACYGFYGYGYATEAAKEALKYAVPYTPAVGDVVTFPQALNPSARETRYTVTNVQDNVVAFYATDTGSWCDYSDTVEHLRKMGMAKHES